MKYELEYEVEWSHDGGFFSFSLDYMGSRKDIVDDNGKRIEDEKEIDRLLREAEIDPDGFCGTDGDEQYIGPVLVEVTTADTKPEDPRVIKYDGDSLIIRFTSEDVDALKRDGGVDFREADLKIARGIKHLLHLLGDDLDKTRSRVEDVLNRVLTEEVMDS